MEALAVVAETRALDPAELHHARRIVNAAARISEAHRARTQSRVALVSFKTPAPAPDGGLSRQQRRAQERAVRKAQGPAQ